jgi:hypothetical protein
MLGSTSAVAKCGIQSPALIPTFIHFVMTHPLDPVESEPASTERRDSDLQKVKGASKPHARVAFLDTKAANAASNTVAGNKRGYVKPVHGIQTKGFAHSGQPLIMSSGKLDLRGTYIVVVG